MKVLGKALAVIMLLALVGAGSATAAKMITGKQVKNGSLTGADIKQGSVGSGDLSAAAQAAMKGDPGPAGPAGPAGVAGPAGPAGSADRYSEVLANGVLQDDRKGIVQPQVSHALGSGTYCFTLLGSSRPKAGAANGLAGDTLTVLEIDADGGIAGCPAAATVRVQTWDVSLGLPADRAFRVMLEND